jgi:hypothetical protein
VALAIGALLALAVGILAGFVGFDRDRAFYPTVTMVVASYYALFAVMGKADEALVIESIIGALFVVVAVAGFRSSLWLVVAALAAHGIFDFVRGTAIANPGVPIWWPQFCGAYDVIAAGCLAWLLTSGRLRSAAQNVH